MYSYDRTMTSEKRTLVEIGDIRSLEIACRNSKCGSSVSVGISADGTPQTCPSCHQSLFDHEHGQWESVKELRRAMQALLKDEISNVRLDIRTVLAQST
jgi:hypothetical protein